MGYVAELQQFDPVPPHVYDLAQPEPIDPAVPARTTPVTVRIPPRASRAPIVSHIRQQPRRRTRAAMLGGTAAVILGGVFLGYAAFGGPDDRARAQSPGAIASAVPADGSLPLDPALPGAEPLTGRTTTPAAASTGAAGRTGTPVPDTTKLPLLPGLPDSARPVPVSTEAPPAAPATTAPPAPVAPLPLAATLSHVVDTSEDGFLGYAGTVRIANPGDREVTGWRVTLTVPGGSPVTASGASVAQDGETVTFTPDGDPTVPAGATVSFSFEVPGLLTVLPGGCAIDGSPCS